MVAAAGRIERLDRLERIIQTQALLVQADLALNPFMQLVIDKLRELTQAHGASVDFVDGEHTVVRRASGVVTVFTLPRGRGQRFREGFSAWLPGSSGDRT